MGKLIEIENRYYKECSVIMLPTKDNSIITLNTNKEIHLQGNNNPKDYKTLKQFGLTPQHLYITSENEIKEGDWYLDLTYQMVVNEEEGNICGNCRKIVATTDKSLLIEIESDSMRFDEPVGIPLPQIPQQFIEDYVKAGGIDEVLLEYETNYINWKHDDKIEALIDTLELKTDQNNCVITHPVEPKLYTKDESRGKRFRYIDTDIIKLKLNQDNTVNITSIKDNSKHIYHINRLTNYLCTKFDKNTSELIRIQIADWIEKNL